MKKIFIIHSREDEKILKKLLDHMAILKEEYAVDLWCDRFIKPGENIDQITKEKLNNADLIIILVSSDLLASKYKEIKEAKKRQNEKGVVLFPVIVRDCVWQGVFEELRVLPKEGKPIVSKDQRIDDERCTQVINEIKEFIERKNRTIPFDQPTIKPIPQNKTTFFTLKNIMIMVTLLLFVFMSMVDISSKMIEKPEKTKQESSQSTNIYKLIPLDTIRVAVPLFKITGDTELSDYYKQIGADVTISKMYITAFNKDCRKSVIFHDRIDVKRIEDEREQQKIEKIKKENPFVKTLLIGDFNPNVVKGKLALTYYLVDILTYEILKEYNGYMINSIEDILINFSLPKEIEDLYPCTTK